MRPFCHLYRYLLSLFIGLAAPYGCGGRTRLESQEPCYTEGEYRKCNDLCGEGAQRCERGYWQACRVAPIEVECTNDCGEGLAHCENGVKAECVVEPQSKACDNDCGDGLSWCENGIWGECEVDPKERDCKDSCGTGTETCEAGVWGECYVPRQQTECFSACGSGVEVCENNTRIACNAPQPLPPKLFATIRDFKIAHPDFERNDLTGSYLDSNIVAEDLGSDNLPVWIATSANPTVTTKANFDQWFRDLSYDNDNAPTNDLPVNTATNIWLPMSVSPTVPGLFVYEDTSFFPIDGQLFGNEGLEHNYHFTMMVQTEFIYVGGENFYFEGDDDMWVFINRKLAIDLGGIHESMSASISLDENAKYLGITPGGRYRLDFFFAERKTVASDFTIRTTIADVGSCP